MNIKKIKRLLFIIIRSTPFMFYLSSVFIKMIETKIQNLNKDFHVLILLTLAGLSIFMMTLLFISATVFIFLIQNNFSWLAASALITSCYALFLLFIIFYYKKINLNLIND